MNYRICLSSSEIDVLIQSRLPIWLMKYCRDALEKSPAVSAFRVLVWRGYATATGFGDVFFPDNAAESLASRRCSISR